MSKNFRQHYKKCSKSNNFSMTFTILIIMTTICSTLVNSLKTQENSTLSVVKVMVDVIEKFYIANNIRFDFLIYGEATQHIKDVINEVTKKLNGETIVNIQTVDDIYKWHHQLNESTIILTKSKTNLQQLHQMTRNAHINYLRFINLPHKTTKFSVYVEDFMKFHDITDTMQPRLFSLIHPDMRFYEFMITRDENLIALYASVIYSERICGKFHPKLLNTFNTETQNWYKKLEDFNQFSNFHGCLMSFAVDFEHTWYTEEYFNIYDKKVIEKLSKSLTNEKLTFRGLTHEILTSMAKKHNFKLHYTLAPKPELIPISGTNNLMFKQIATERMGEFTNYWSFFAPIMSIQEVKRNMGENYVSFWTDPIDDMEFYYLITRNEMYGNYEKILMPFDLTTWILLAVTFLLTFGFIFAIHKCPNRIKTILFGEGIRTPAYNALGVIFGIPQFRLPQESSNRLALGLFIWFCLMFRTCWQSMMFEFMTTDMRKPLPTSIDDLREMNYTIVLPHEIMNLTKRLIFTKKEYRKIKNETNFNIIGQNRKPPNLMTVSENQFVSMYKEAVEGQSNMKLAFFVDNLQHAFFNTSLKNSLPIMQNEKHVMLIGYTVLKNQILSHEILDTVSHFIQTGLAKHLMDYAKLIISKPYKPEVVDPRRVFSLSDLEFGFILWLASLSLPISCFFCEVLLKSFIKAKKILAETLLFAMTKIIEMSLKTFMGKYHDKW